MRLTNTSEDWSPNENELNLGSNFVQPNFCQCCRGSNSLYRSSGPPYLCSTRQWLDEGWIVGGYSPDIVLICMAFIYRICMQYPHFTNAYDLSTRHLSIPVLYPPVTCACPPYIYDRHLYLQFIQRMSAVIYNTRSACFIHVIF